MARITAFLCLLCLLAPAGALAQENPFGPIPPAPPQQTEPPEDQQENPNVVGDEDDGLSRRQQLIILLGGVVFVLGIAWFILRDARRTAPAVAAHRPEEEGGTKSKGSQRPKKQRVAQGRAKAKQARRQRKKNR